jgi:hypothetical protein
MPQPLVGRGFGVDHVKALGAGVRLDQSANARGTLSRHQPEVDGRVRD